ncbi:MAG: hypothetical protein AAGA58_06405 [Verrucomicrobiota bacterium]
MYRLIFISSVWLFGAVAGVGTAQEAPDAGVGAAGEESPLGIRQLRIKRLLGEIEDRFNEIAEKIEAENPEEAGKLREAIGALQEKLLTQRIDDIASLLDAANLETASEAQQELIVEVKDLLNLLLEEESEAERREREIRELREWKEALDELIEREKDIRQETETTENTEKAAEALEGDIEKVDELIEKQKELKNQTENVKGRLEETDRLGAEQRELREETEDLAKEADPDQKPGEESNQPGIEPLKKASSEQAGAEKELQKSNPGKAASRQEKALENLQDARQKLAKEKERVEELNAGERNKELAEEQKDEQEKTEELAQEMAESEQANEGDGAQQLQQSLENLKQAGKSMGKSGQKLQEQKPQEAKPEQDKALEDLERAKENIEDRLAQLEEEEKLEQLAKLEEIFRGMLERQVAVSEETTRIDTKRVEQEGDLRRADRLALRKGSEEERELADTAMETRQALDDSDESVVFRDIVRNLGESLGEVADLLDQQISGEITQKSQDEIELTLEELIDALAEARNNPQAGKQQQQAEGQPGEMQQRMLPPSAELKLLKLSQLRVNRRTLDLHAAIGDVPRIENTLQGQLDDLSVFQRRLGVMAREIGARANLTVETVD